MLPLHWSITNAPGPGSATCGTPLLKCIIRVTTNKQWNALPSLILGRGDSNLNTSQTLILLIHLVPWQRSQRQAALPRSLSRIPTDSHSLGAGWDWTVTLTEPWNHPWQLVFRRSVLISSWMPDVSEFLFRSQQKHQYSWHIVPSTENTIKPLAFPTRS